MHAGPRIGFRLVVVGGLSLVGFTGIAFAWWWHDASDLRDLERHAQAVQMPDHAPPMPLPHEFRFHVYSNIVPNFAVPGQSFPTDLATLLASTPERAIPEGPIEYILAWDLVSEDLCRACDESDQNLARRFDRILSIAEQVEGPIPELNWLIRVMAYRYAFIPESERVRLTQRVGELGQRAPLNVRRLLQGTWHSFWDIPAVHAPSMSDSRSWAWRFTRKAYGMAILNAYADAETETALARVRTRLDQGGFTVSPSRRMAGQMDYATGWWLAEGLAYAALGQALAAHAAGREMPVDPCAPGGDALRQVRAADGTTLTVYSLGLDGVDQGGAGGSDHVMVISLPQDAP